MNPGSFSKPYAELPYPWTIGWYGREKGGDQFFGLNVLTGLETQRFDTYGEALKEVERREVHDKKH